MERVYAFTDESGAFGWDLDNPSVSTIFVITAIIVKESELDSLRAAVEQIRAKYFQTGEMKSSKIGSNHIRRKKILAELVKLPFSILSVIVDKRLLEAKGEGFKYKDPFYKFLNNIVHKELRRAFTKITIVADELCGNEYMKSFSQYVKKKQDIPNLLCEADFLFENSKNDVLIQLADLISGTLFVEYDEHKKRNDTPSFHKMFDKKSRIEWYPKTIDKYVLENSAIATEYDKEIASICLKQAIDYINIHDKDMDEDTIAQIIVLKYLLFRFMNNDTREYIPTHELKKQLSFLKSGTMSTQTFRIKIIGKLRDKGVIISGSSSKKGDKIPAKYEEVIDFINHGTTIIMPMLERIKKCRDLIKLGTNNEVDLFDKTEYASLKRYFEM